MTTPIPEVTGYHAHVYYDEASRADAAVVREALDALFTVRLGRWRDEPVGPHPETGFDLEDHRDRALWMGRVLDLNLDVLG